MAVFTLILNTVPLVTLGGFVAFYGTRIFLAVSLWIILLSGTALWLFGRSAYHVGASSVLFGYFGYLVARVVRAERHSPAGRAPDPCMAASCGESCRHGPIFLGRVTCLGCSLACWWRGLPPRSGETRRCPTWAPPDPHRNCIASVIRCGDKTALPCQLDRKSYLQALYRYRWCQWW